MNTDIRLSVEFWDHPKTVKLERRLGLVAVKSLQLLWLWAAQNRPDGLLSGMDEEDMEIAAKWTGEPGAFVKICLELRWIDLNESLTTVERSFNGTRYELHDWKIHNPWAAESEDRSNKSRLSRMAKTHPGIYEKLVSRGIVGISREEYDLYINEKPIHEANFNDSLTTVERPLTNALSPAPAPSPSPSPKELKTNAYSASQTHDAALVQPAEPLAAEENRCMQEPEAVDLEPYAVDPEPAPCPQPEESSRASPGRWYQTKKKRRLSGEKLRTFEQFWQAFAYQRGKAEAADAWLEIEDFTAELAQTIIGAARREAVNRKNITEAGLTPKMAQGWIVGRRWEDSADSGNGNGTPEWFERYRREKEAERESQRC